MVLHIYEKITKIEIAFQLLTVTGCFNMYLYDLMLDDITFSCLWKTELILKYANKINN